MIMCPELNCIGKLVNTWSCTSYYIVLGNWPTHNDIPLTTLCWVANQSKTDNHKSICSELVKTMNSTNSVEFSQNHTCSKLVTATIIQTIVKHHCLFSRATFISSCTRSTSKLHRAGFASTGDRRRCTGEGDWRIRVAVSVEAESRSLQCGSVSDLAVDFLGFWVCFFRIWGGLGLWVVN